MYKLHESSWYRWLQFTEKPSFQGSEKSTNSTISQIEYIMCNLISYKSLAPFEEQTALCGAGENVYIISASTQRKFKDFTHFLKIFSSEIKDL